MLSSRQGAHSVSLVAEISTLRRHLESHHKVSHGTCCILVSLTEHVHIQAEYLKWAEANGFTSMLPKDAKERINKQNATGMQSRLDGHLQPVPPKEKAIRYSDELFREAVVRWIVDTS